MNINAPTAKAQSSIPTLASRKPVPAAMEALTGHDFIKKAEGIAIHWWSVIESVIEVGAYGESGRAEPLPAWAVERLQDQGRLQSSYEEHREQLQMARETLYLAEGSGASYRYEIWTSRIGHRLEIQHESKEQADAALDLVKIKHSDAFIARVHVKAAVFGYSNPAMLDTMIGKIFHCGTTFASSGREEEFTVQDETGRTVTVGASVLLGHDVYSRMSPQAKEHIQFCVNKTALQKQNRIESTGEGA